jgi:competence protein ComEA
MRRAIAEPFSKLFRSHAYYPLSFIVSLLLILGIVVNVLIRTGNWPPAFAGQRSPVTITSNPTPTPPATVEALIMGDVHVPGLYKLPPRSHVRDLVEIAGGAYTTADLARVSLDAALANGQSVYVPRVGETIPPERNGRIDLNAAGTEQLHYALGITLTIARRIVEYRTTHGPFSSVSELLLVPVAKTTYDRIKDLVTV